MGRSTAGLTIKIHALFEAWSRPIRRTPMSGQAGDAPVASELMQDLAASSTPIVDRACDRNAIRDLADAPRG